MPPPTASSVIPCGDLLVAEAVCLERLACADLELSEERLVRENVPGAVFYIGMPTVMYGLEGVDEDAEDYVVQAHAWPPQREEWQLDYWLDQGFSIFVVKNLPGGPYVVTSGSAAQVIRAWAAGSAPPQTAAQLVLVDQPLVVRGQEEEAEASEGFLGMSGLGLVAVGATAIVIPILIAESDDDDPPASP